MSKYDNHEEGCPCITLPSDIDGAKPGDVFTQDGWKSALKKYYRIQPPPRHTVSAVGKTPLHATILTIGETRIKILEDKANNALIQPGMEYGKIQTAIKEVKILLDLIHEVK